MLYHAVRYFSGAAKQATPIVIRKPGVDMLLTMEYFTCGLVKVLQEVVTKDPDAVSVPSISHVFECFDQSFDEPLYLDLRGNWVFEELAV